MGHQRLSRTARYLVTVMLLVAVVVTTFLPDWVQRSLAAAPAVDTAAYETAAVTTGDVAGPARVVAPELAPLNALILSEPGRAEALKSALLDLGGYVYVSQGDALYAGVNDLALSDLAPLGARAVYRGAVPGSDLAALSPNERDAAQVWNDMAGAEPVGATIAGGDIRADSQLIVPRAEAPGPREPGSLYEPTSDQTSTFMIGSVAVEVVFVESTTAAENWTADEISKVKSEVVSAFDWWTVTARAPKALDELEFGEDPLPRPPAYLTWQVNYHSPLEGTDADRLKVQVPTEPITRTTDYNTLMSWMVPIASNFVGGTGEGRLRVWADQARQPSLTSPGADWGFVLFVVDSSNTPTGRFADGKISAAALNGPWAVVNYNGGDLGVNNLEVIIAKMVGHVFGAGDEANCHSTPGDEEYFGYLRVAHENCAFGFPTVPSLMLDDAAMVEAYKEHRVSQSARGQVGWLDGDDNGIYDVIDTLQDTYEAPPSPEVCPVLHLTDIDVANTPALPSEFGPGPYGEGNENGWWGYVWNPATNMMDFGVEYHKVNINRVGYVWGRINDGEWIAGSPADGDPEGWNSAEEGYNLLLPGNPGETNRVEIAIMNRWGHEAYLSPDPVNVPVQAAKPTNALPYESGVASNAVTYFDYGSPGGWTTFNQANYSGGSTLLANGPGYEACFSFTGNEVNVLYNNEATGHMDVVVDGALHSTIAYTGAGSGGTPLQHKISNLPDGDHTVQLFAGGYDVDFDAFLVSDMRANTLSVIDALDVLDIPADEDGFYENTGAKIKYVGQWATQTPYTLNAGRPGTPDDFVHTSLHANDRIYFRFKRADTVAIYREVFPGGGTADVYVDDGTGSKYWGTMDNDATVAMVTPFIISGLLSQDTVTYTVEIRMNPGSPRFTFDALRFLNMATSPDLYKPVGDDPLEIPFNGAQEMNGNWVPATTYIRGANTGDLLTVFFQGMAIAVNRQTSSRLGIMELYADGKLVRTVDNRDLSARDAPVVLHGFDPNRPHVLQVRVIRENAGVARWNHIFGFTVFNVPTVGPGTYEEYQYDAGGVPTHSYFVYEQLWNTPITYTGVPGPSGQHYISSKHRDAKAFLYFTGADTATIYGVSSARFGAADVYINGELRGTFVQKGRIGYNKPFTITGLDKLAVNVLELRVHVQRGMPSFISLDRVVLYNRPVLAAGTYENDALIGEIPALQFSGQWSRLEHASASGTYDMVGSAYDQVVFDVRDASSVVIYRRLFRRYGSADVYVDGVYHSSFNNNTTTALTGVFQQPTVIGGLDRGFSHRIVIKPTLDKRGRHKPFDIDYIVVRSGDTSGISYLEDNFYDQADASALAGGAISFQGSYWTISNPTPSNTSGLLGAGTEAHGSGRGDRAVVVFRGNAFSVFFNRFSRAGKVQIYIDGTLAGTMNNRSFTPVYDVPFAVAGLEEKTHTAEIIILSGQVGIDAFMARTMLPDDVDNQFDLKQELALGPMQRAILVSGLWQVEGDYIITREKDAALYAYGTNGDTLFMTRRALVTHGQIGVWINNELHTTAENAYLRGWPTSDEVFKVSGLHDMIDGRAWIGVKNAQAKVIQLKQLRISELTPKLGSDCILEAENLDAPQPLQPAGAWKRMPLRANDIHSGGFYLESRTVNSRLYIPVQYVNYLTIFRPVSRALGDAEVYIDGEFWGIMPSQGGRAQAQVPFSIGPIESPSQAHVIELRPADKRKKIAVDWMQCEGLTTLSPAGDDYFGYYENNSEPLTGLDATGAPVGMSAYSGVWSEVASTDASGGSIHRTTRRGDRLAALFTGNSITIYRETSGLGRFATVYIDGIAYPINNRSTTLQRRVPHTILLPGDPEQTHSLELVVNSGQFNLDAIQVDYAEPGAYGVYQENHPQVIVNDTNHWETVDSEAHSAGAYIVTNDKYASVFFLFNGQRVTTYMMQGRYWGRVSMYLDGQFREEVDLRKYDRANPGAPDEPFFAYDITNLPPGYHALELRFEGKRTRGGALKANFDVFSVNGAPVPRPDEEIFPPTPPDIGGGDPGGELLAPRDGCYEEAHPEWDLVGDWIPYGWTGASYDTLAVLDNQDPEAGVYAEFDFAATGFGLMVGKGPNGGTADIYVNGVLYIADYSMYNATQIALDPVNTLISGTGYDPNVRNVVRIVWKDVAGLGGGKQIYIDRLDLPAYDSQYNNNCIYTGD